MHGLIDMRYHLFGHWWYDHGQGGKQGYIESSDSKEKLLDKVTQLYYNKQNKDYLIELFDSETLKWEDV